MVVRRTKAEREAVYNPSPERVAELLTPPCSCHEREAENARLTEKNAALVAFVGIVGDVYDIAGALSDAFNAAVGIAEGWHRDHDVVVTEAFFRKYPGGRWLLEVVGTKVQHAQPKQEASR